MGKWAPKRRGAVTRAATRAREAENRKYCPVCHGRCRTTYGMIAEIKRPAPNVQVSVTYVRLRVAGLAGEELRQLDLKSLCLSYASTRAQGLVAEDEIQEARSRAR